MPYNFENKKIIVAGHFHTPVPIMDLANFLKGRAKILLLIRHPFFYNKKNGSSLTEFYGSKEREIKKFFYREKISELGLYFKSFLMTIKWILNDKVKFDVFVGLGTLEALSGIILRMVGRGKVVVYYAIDFVPERFKNKALNKIFHLIDNFVIRKSDFIWNLSPIMIEMREKKGISAKYRKKQVTVPIGTDTDVPVRKFEEIDKNVIAYIGSLREGQGLEFLMDCLPEIKKQMPAIRLDIIGEGSLRPKLEEKISLLGLRDNVSFLGFMATNREAEEILSKCALAVAPYEDTKECFTRYTDPGKIKTYVSAGLPVIITKVPQVAYEIEKDKCGVAVNYDKKEFMDAVVGLLADEKKLKEYRANAVNFAHKYSWDKVFDRAFDFIK